MKEKSANEVLRAGSVVVSTAGRDRRRVFIVTDVTEEAGRIMAAVSDGSLRKIAKGKRKNVRHLRVIGAVTENELAKLIDEPSDGFIKKLIGKYDPLQNAAGSSLISRPERGGGEN
ncbi:MAG: hypothetical protein IKI03_06565 [Clostridia bacterium]|nr:hypothetical protein [Clostridia bacterium]